MMAVNIRPLYEELDITGNEIAARMKRTRSERRRARDRKDDANVEQLNDLLIADDKLITRIVHAKLRQINSADKVLQLITELKSINSEIEEMVESCCYPHFA